MPSYNFSVSAVQAQALVLGRFAVVFSPQTTLATTSALSAEAVSVYPNPAHSSFAVTMPGVMGASAVQAELVNTLGQVVRRQSAGLPASGTSFSVPTAELAAGVYVLRLQAGDTTLTKRVVVH
jgi:EAL domain-containing protein (putative c-di-GMP-specific phosphodiesterase class I)